MLDNKYFRQDIDKTAEALKKRHFELDVTTISHLEEKRKTLQVQTQELQNLRNVKSKAIGIAKAKGEDIKPFLAEVDKASHDLANAEQELEITLKNLHELIIAVPNLLHESVPVGKSEEENVEVSTWGHPKEFSFPIKDHVDLGEGLGLLSFAKSSKITGSRFVVMQGELVKLQRALTRFMLDIHTKQHGYQEVYVPYIVNSESLFGTGQLPKFEEDLFKLKTEHDFYLIPTAEVPVTNLLRDEIVDAENLPLKFVTHTPCFRSEAGSYGKDTRGLIRQHQFEKVELVQIVKPEDSYEALEILTSHAEKILQLLELPYRKMMLCSGDVGFCSAKTYDLEVWLPAQNCYREISSCSNFEAFQARRMKARYKSKDNKKPELVHTLNGSGLAIGRTLVAILENYQNSDGRITIPEILRPYMDDATLI